LEKIPVGSMTAGSREENKGKCRYKGLYPGTVLPTELQLAFRMAFMLPDRVAPHTAQAGKLGSIH